MGDGPHIAATVVLGGGLSSLGHGLADDLVARDWPRLSEAELAPLLAQYPRAGAVAAVTWHSERPFAASAIVRCAQGAVFVKRHDPRVRSAADLAEEHGFIAHLRGRGAAVPAVLATGGGATAVASAGGSYEVHALGDGADRYRDAHSWTPAESLADADAIGQALAALHRAAAGFAAPARQTRLLIAGDALIREPDLAAALARRVAEDPRLERALAGRPWRADLAAALTGWHRAAQPYLQDLAPLWVHGDLHASNLLWRDGVVSAVLDFGMANRASAVFDLATTIERNAIAWLQLSPDKTAIGRADLAAALLQGYDRVRPRPAAEIAALRHVLPVVHVDFALSELAYFDGVTGSAGNAEAAYGDFLLGHARWFAGQDGRRFLETLKG